MKKSFHFPYKTYKGNLYPLVNIQLHGPQGPLETQACVDSGASMSIFLTQTAADLGINYTKGKIFYTMVGDGSSIPVYIHRIPVKIGNILFHAKIGFSSQLGAAFNLLGQTDFFDRFLVTFNHRQKRVSFKPF